MGYGIELVPKRVMGCARLKSRLWAPVRFHTPKAVTYHEPKVMRLYMIGHSLGRIDLPLPGAAPPGSMARTQSR